MTGPDPAMAAAADLTESFQAMTAQMKRLTRSESRNRRIITGLAVSICLDVAITIGLTAVTIRQDDVQNALRASDIRQCQLANDARDQDVAIWNRLLVFPPGSHPTAGQRAEVADLERLVRVKDTPRDCEKAFRKK